MGLTTSCVSSLSVMAREMMKPTPSVAVKVKFFDVSPLSKVTFAGIPL